MKNFHCFTARSTSKLIQAITGSPTYQQKLLDGMKMTDLERMPV